MADDAPIINPPANFTVDIKEKQPVLYRYDGVPLIKRPIGFNTDKTAEKK